MNPHTLPNGHPFNALTEFLQREHALTVASATTKDLEQQLRFVGYVLDLGYDNSRVITCDPLKNIVGGIPRSSFLILAPRRPDELPPHFSVLRVRDTAPTPLSEQVQQTYFELHKKSMPELDIWTTNELQWGALNCDVLGMMYPDPDEPGRVAFAGDQANIRSPHHYLVYSPPDDVLDLIVNGLVPAGPRRSWSIGALRPTETQFHHLLNGSKRTNPIDVRLASADFVGTRTAMFGKTRLGKSNVVKLIAEGVITNPPEDTTVGQIIFDVNGEYANDNAWDGSGGGSLCTAYPKACTVYALKPRPRSGARELRLNFYVNAPEGMAALREFLESKGRQSIYMKNFASVAVPDPAEIRDMAYDGERNRYVRKVLTYWAILYRAGFKPDRAQLNELKITNDAARGPFCPNFQDSIRKLAYGEETPPPKIITLEQLARELELIADHAKSKRWKLKSTSSGDLFDADDQALLNFLAPTGSGAGPATLGEFRDYHSPNASAFTKEIGDLAANGKTVILDLGSASDTIRQYFADTVSHEIFRRQEEAFTENRLGKHYVQLYFEEAHNLFPPGGSQDMKGIYARFAKEGAKFHIGMVYSTQSPSTINGELLTQTENFFVGHLSSEGETKALSRLQTAFSGVEQDILRTKQPGYMRMLTRSHRFVVPVQARKFEAGK